ncbi:hypothetical protein CHS0354_039637 [Potamilus streckersoni]|uniref:Uncharacterized protein n=1 Tax=Potamilus streckersoni TaxID=2493646 RepID=A0AAE0SJM8_9BIVA|nr:hypothetical protein CHS0354_039637 [Potamilus streckersoni]
MVLCLSSRSDAILQTQFNMKRPISPCPVGVRQCSSASCVELLQNKSWQLNPDQRAGYQYTKRPCGDSGNMSRRFQNKSFPPSAYSEHTLYYDPY